MDTPNDGAKPPDSPPPRRPLSLLETAVMSSLAFAVLPPTPSKTSDFATSIEGLAAACGLPVLQVHHDVLAAATSNNYELTPEGISLWADAVARGETGFGEILLEIGSERDVNEPADPATWPLDEIDVSPPVQPYRDPLSRAIPSSGIVQPKPKLSFSKRISRLSRW
jgi:hypothetical protein